jgi:hypothetical protein
MLSPLPRGWKNFRNYHQISEIHNWHEIHSRQGNSFTGIEDGHGNSPSYRAALFLTKRADRIPTSTFCLFIDDCVEVAQPLPLETAVVVALELHRCVNDRLSSAFLRLVPSCPFWHQAHGNNKYALSRDVVIGITYVSWVEAVHVPQGDQLVLEPVVQLELDPFTEE